MRTLAVREQVLVALAPFVIGGAIHVRGVLLPLAREVSARTDELARLEADVERRKRTPTLPDPEARRLASRRDELAALLEQDGDVEKTLLRTAPRSEAAAMEAISSLASRAGLAVRESTPERTAEPTTGRPRRKIVALATFEGLRAFVAGLSSLPCGAVRVERLEVETTTVAAERGGGEGVRVLVATFVVLL